MQVRNRILPEVTIIALQTFLLLTLTATLGVERGEQPTAAQRAPVSYAIATTSDAEKSDSAATMM